jgi:hypothetical protein
MSKLFNSYKTAQNNQVNASASASVNMSNVDMPDNKISMDLRRELGCAICHEVLFEPVSLHCGHNFCGACLKWWLLKNHDNYIQQQRRELVQGEDQPGAPKRAKQHGSCPTCRRAVPVEANSLSVNTALRACVAALFGDELAVREQAEKAVLLKATAGEDGGSHERGYEIVNPIDEERWTTIRGKTKRFGAITARRSIVLDDQDQRMQLALALWINGPDGTAVQRLGTTSLQISICLLTMEEDEAGDGGFPVILDNEDDEHLLTKEERFYSPVEVTGITKQRAGTEHVNVPVARRTLGSEGVVQFEIDTSTTELRDMTCFCFRHMETGAELHMSLPWGAAADDSNERALEDRAVGVDTMGSTDHFVEEQDHDHEDSGPDEFEDDDFIVDEDDDEDVDEDELCCMCRDGGELIVCDGGDIVAGCGCNFHLGCIKRDVIPPGDWVCEGCATNYGLDNVGVEGHEFVENPYGGEDKPDEAQKGRLKRIHKETITIDSSDEEEFGRTGSFSPEVHSVDEDEDDPADDESPPKVAPTHRAKRLRIIDSDDDDE